jgi:hypothetical protein
MLYWEAADQDPSLDDAMLEWAALEEIEQLRPEPGEGDIAVGGATLAAEAAESDLIDE